MQYSTQAERRARHEVGFFIADFNTQKRLFSLGKTDCGSLIFSWLYALGAMPAEAEREWRRKWKPATLRAIGDNDCLAPHGKADLWRACFEDVWSKGDWEAWRWLRSGEIPADGDFGFVSFAVMRDLGYAEAEIKAVGPGVSALYYKETWWAAVSREKRVEAMPIKSNSGCAVFCGRALINTHA